MPQDDVEEVRAALLGARHANENPVFYRMYIHLLAYTYVFVNFSALCRWPREL